MDLSDGSEKLLTKGIIHYPTFSPDGKWLVFTNYKDRVALWKVPVEDGAPTQILVENALCSAVSPDGKTIAFALSTILLSTTACRTSGGSRLTAVCPSKLPGLKPEESFNFAYSPGGKQLALSRGSLNSDVFLIKNSE
jgi:Periplasmic component of the Tol biopolymer transport system